MFQSKPHPAWLHPKEEKQMTNLEKFEQILSEYKELEPGSLTLETTFEELELDSLDLVDMTMACEDAFGVSIELTDDLKTVGDLLKLVEKD
jgi:acyl carrier protein